MVKVEARWKAIAKSVKRLKKRWVKGSLKSTWKKDKLSPKRFRIRDVLGENCPQKRGEKDWREVIR